MTWRFHALFGVVATLVVGFAIAWGFMLVGSPSARRLERFDEQRVQDLQTIARQIADMCIQLDEKRTLKRALPKTLEEVAEAARVERVNLLDPETGEPYVYSVKSDSTFEVCATFARARNSDHSVFWNHSVGTKCYTIDLLDPPPFR